MSCPALALSVLTAAVLAALTAGPVAAQVPTQAMPPAGTTTAPAAPQAQAHPTRDLERNRQRLTQRRRAEDAQQFQQNMLGLAMRRRNN